MSFLANNKFLSRFFRRDPSSEPNLHASASDDNNGASYRIESDQPIQNYLEDKFGRWNFARRFADVIAKRTDPQTIVLGIHAPWGEGKTSVLNMIRQRFADYNHVELIKFNPWRFPDETQLLRHFFNVLAERLDSNIIKPSEKAGELLRRYSDALMPLKYFGVDLSGAAKAVAPMAADIEVLKERLIEILVKSNKRL